MGCEFDVNLTSHSIFCRDICTKVWVVPVAAKYLLQICDVDNRISFAIIAGSMNQALWCSQLIHPTDLLQYGWWRECSLSYWQWIWDVQSRICGRRCTKSYLSLYCGSASSSGNFIIITIIKHVVASYIERLYVHSVMLIQEYLPAKKGSTEMKEEKETTEQNVNALLVGIEPGPKDVNMRKVTIESVWMLKWFKVGFELWSTEVERSNHWAVWRP